jgi:redox-sensitive bicupin YhaK (pirin superfamily)
MNTTSVSTTKPKAQVRRSGERGQTQISWLESRHTFSFSDYYDPEHMAFRSLRVINEDWVKEGMGFGTHPHRDMEILTYVVSGELQHRDSMGNGRIIKPGELQAMTAGSGITHSEFNPSRTEPVHLLQIWIMPNQRNLKPSYAEWKPEGNTTGPLTLLASPDAAIGSVLIHQDAKLLLGKLGAGESVVHRTDADRGLWLQVVKGDVQAGGAKLGAGDAVSVENAAELALTTESGSEFLLFDLA